MEDLAAHLGALEAALLSWDRIHEQVRPHQILGYKPREQSYQDWLRNSHTRREVLSDIY